MQEYLQAIKIKFTADDASYKLIQDKINDFATELNQQINNGTVKLETDTLKSLTNDFIYNGRKVIDMSAEELETIKDSLSLKEELQLFEQIKQLEKEWAMLIDLGTSKALEKADLVAKEIYALNEILGKHDTTDSEEMIETTDPREIATNVAGKIGSFTSAFADELAQGNSQMSKAFGGFLNDMTKLGTDLVRAFAGDVTAIEDIVSAGLKKFGELIAGGLDELNNITKFSTLSDSNYRSMAFGYGMTSAEAYGIEKAKSVTGLQSEEDIIWAIQEGGVVGKKFLESYEKYLDKYNKLYDSGTFNKILEFNMEMTEYQEDLKLQVAEFFMENKDTIKAALDMFMTLSRFVLNFMEKMSEPSLFGRLLTSTKADTMINNSTSTNNSNVNVKIDNNFNGVEREDKQYLTNIGLVVAEPLVKILEEGGV